MKSTLKRSAKSAKRQKKPSKAKVDRAQSKALLRLIAEQKARTPEIKILRGNAVGTTAMPNFLSVNGSNNWHMFQPAYDAVVNDAENPLSIIGQSYRPRKWIFKMCMTNTSTVGWTLVRAHLMLINLASISNVDSDTLSEIKIAGLPDQKLTYATAFTGEVKNFLHTRMPYTPQQLTVADNVDYKAYGKDLKMLKTWTFNIKAKPTTETNAINIKPFRMEYEYPRQSKYLRANTDVGSYVLEKGWVPLLYMSASESGIQYHYETRFYYQDDG